ncbi:MAG: hypothetical protein ACLR1U_03220 [Clostridia bacterium]
MLSYIASNSTAEIIKNVCKEQNITILNQEVEEIDFFKYIKQTKVNFNLVKYFVIDLKQIKNTKDEIINSIKYFKEMYVNTRLIIIAKGYDNQNIILTTLYENRIFNIINNSDEQQIKVEIEKCLLGDGLQEKDAKRFKRIEEVKVDKKVKFNIIPKLKEKLANQEKVQKPSENIETQNQINSSVYFFAVLVDAIKSLVRLLCYIAIFILTSVGLTFLFNEELRNVIFQILGLK